MPAPPIPYELISVYDVRDALLQYAKTRPNPPGLHLGGDRDISVPFNTARKILADLQLHRGPGPVVLAQPDTGGTHLVGRTRIPTGRTSISLRLPDGPLTQLDPIPTLAGAVASVGIVAALVERCELVADAYGSTRQAGQYRREATALAEFGEDLTSCVPDLAEAFLTIWQAEAASRGEPAPAPPVRAAHLR